MPSRVGLPPNISVPLLPDFLDAFSPSPSIILPSPSCSIDESYKYIFLPICYSFTFIFSISLNSIILYRSFRRTKRWNASLIYMVNLASTDFMYGLSLPFLVASYVMRDRWVFGDFMCRLVRFLFYFNLYCSIFFLTCISVHRYLGICHPMRVITLETKKAVKCTCVVVWIVVFALTCPIFRFAQTGHVTRLAGFGGNASSTVSLSHEVSLMNGNSSNGNLGVVIEEYQNCWDDAIDKEFPDYVPSLHIQPSSSRASRTGGHEGILRRSSPAIDGRGRRGSNGMSRTRGRDEGVSIFLGANSPYANRRRKSIKTIITITLLFALCFFPFHVTRTIFLLLKVTKRVPCHTMTMVSMCYKITRPLASFNAWLNALLYFLTKDKGGAHCCHTVNSTNHQHGGLLLPLRMMGKGKDADDGGVDGGMDDEENKALHNSGPYMNRAKVRFIVE
ncbi:P2Y purinoceptor 2 isoform X2 [Notolabrus celidotus]|uniref:P2Y purinoceptor 2 isoform X2 n=1 Tax=Notolabrus celidotus TaxID=1203425 RepID=UPI00148FD0A0|nr:P2Y purinoceptor 2 isoform X2 [Notolabrus celidotus]